MTFNEAKRAYVHRFTVEHVPEWALKPAPNGRYYAPKYRSDLEWFQHTLFPPLNPFHRTDCHSTGQTWPFGQWLDKPYGEESESI